MQIIKKDGKVEEFIPSKIITSITNAATEGGTILNESDLHIIVKDIIDKIKKVRGEDTPTSSYEVVGAIVRSLNEDRFTDAVNAFVNFTKV